MRGQKFRSRFASDAASLPPHSMPIPIWAVGVLLLHVTMLVALITAANQGMLPGWVSLIRRIPMGDKVAHFVLFGFLAFMANVCLGWREIRLGTCRMLIASACILLLTTGEEFSQLLLPRRTFDLLDLTANVLGIVAVGRIRSRP